MCSSLVNNLKLDQQPKLLINNHSFDYSDLRNEDGVDPLNSAIYDLSQRAPLRHLVLKDLLVSSELFRGNVTTPISIWASLQTFQLGGVTMAPSGNWYWTGNPSAVKRGSTDGYGSDANSYLFREPDDSGTDDNSAKDAIRNGWRPIHEWRIKPD